MKKIVSIVLTAVMLISLIPLTVSAAKEKTPFGTVVEAQYTATAPDMKDGVVDESWGEKVAHIDKNSPNSGLTNYSFSHFSSGYKIPEDTSFDAYMRWTDDTLYLCFVSHDISFHGHPATDLGDGFQVDAVFGITDISHYSAELASDKSEYDYNYTYLINGDYDDYSCLASYAAETIETSLAWDEKTQSKIGKLAIPFTSLGLSKKEQAKEGDFVSFVMLCIEAVDGDPSSNTGWIEWGDFFNMEKGFSVPEGQEELYYNAASLNTKTTTANSIKLVGKNAGEATQPEQPTQPETPAEQPSSWAKDEVDAAIAAGLVPADLQKNYTKGISRGDLAKMLSALIEKAYGKAPEKTDSKFTDSTDADVLNAANLGIITGYEDGTFKPEKILKRSEMSVIINRVAKLCGKTVTGFDSEVKFTDTATHWCKGELGWPVHAGIVKGTSATEFSPENTLTVEQTIMMIYRTFEALK